MTDATKLLGVYPYTMTKAAPTAQIIANIKVTVISIAVILFFARKTTCWILVNNLVLFLQKLP